MKPHQGTEGACRACARGCLPGSKRLCHRAMFTGIVTDVGRVRTLAQRGDLRVCIATAYDARDIDIGASIACDGCCLTAVSCGTDAHGNWFCVDVSAESQACTNIGSWRAHTAVNLERPLKMGDELGGHIVSGHVDGVARIVSIEPVGASRRFVFEAPADLARFIAPKGSVTLNGTSLTVNDVDGVRFGVNLIPHTLEFTNWHQAARNDRVNLEIDILARYIARLRDFPDSSSLFRQPG